MMMPSSIPSASSSYGSGASSSSAVVRVEKATSEFLIGPDWTMNIDICDTVNSNQWLAKDVVKAVKKRLQHKNPKVQLLALTLLETMVKNCGDYVHFQIADRNILGEMVKIVKKKAEMHVRDKILVLLDSWQEAFGGPGGKYPQYYWAYEDLRRSGVQFPQRSLDTAPIFTPPMTHPTPRNPQPGYGMPSNSSTRLDEAMAADVERLSMLTINSMRDVLDLLADMLQAVNPSDREAVKDEVIVDLVEQCRSNQKKLMQMLTATGDEELLGQGLELNDSLQTVLAKHDAIASGLPLPTQVTNVNSQSVETQKPVDTASGSTIASGNPSAPVLPVPSNQVGEEEEEEDDFAQLARRHSKPRPYASPSTASLSSDGGPSVNSNGHMTAEEASSPLVTSNALVLSDPPAPVSTTKEQDIIDLLSITLSTSISSAQNSETPSSSTQNPYQGPSPSAQENNPYVSQAYLGNQVQSFHSYVAPWAQPTPQPQVELQPQLQQVAQTPAQSQPQYHSQFYNQPQSQLQQQPQPQPQFSQYSTAYPPPPWAATPGYFSKPNPLSRSPYAHSATQAPSSTPIHSHGSTNLQHVNTNPARGSNGLAMNGDTRTSSSPRSTASLAGQKPFIPSYRLFEELNVLGSTDGNFKATSNSSLPLSGAHSHSMVRRGK